MFETNLCISDASCESADMRCYLRTHVCVCVCECIMWVSMRRSEKNLQESVLSFYPVGSTGQTQISRLGGKCLYSMSYGTNSGLYNLFWRSFLTKIKLQDSPTSYTNKLLNILNKCLSKKSLLNIYFSSCQFLFSQTSQQNLRELSKLKQSTHFYTFPNKIAIFTDCELVFYSIFNPSPLFLLFVLFETGILLSRPGWPGTHKDLPAKGMCNLKCLSPLRLTPPCTNHAQCCNTNLHVQFFLRKINQTKECFHLVSFFNAKLLYSLVNGIQYYHLSPI